MEDKFQSLFLSLSLSLFLFQLEATPLEFVCAWVAMGFFDDFGNKVRYFLSIKLFLTLLVLALTNNDH